MKLNPYLTFDGNCAAAFKFYEQCLGGKDLALMTHAQSPMADQAGPEMRDRIMHARMTVGDTTLMGSDGMAADHTKPQGFSVSLIVDKPEEADRVFQALADKGSVRMPIQETFWAQRFGMLVDQFGIPWMVNCERPM